MGLYAAFTGKYLDSNFSNFFHFSKRNYFNKRKRQFCIINSEESVCFTLRKKNKEEEEKKYMYLLFLIFK